MLELKVQYYYLGNLSKITIYITIKL